MPKKYKYKDYSSDVVKVRGEGFKLPEDYEWIRPERWHRMTSYLLYGIIRAVAWIWCRLILGVHFHGRHLLESRNGGIMLVGNHTQEIGDAFIPILANRRRRINTIMSPANLKVPVLGPLLRMIGGLAVPEGAHQLKRFGEAVSCRARQGRCIVVFPEAHVWPYYTGIRPFPATAFRYAVENSLPVFTMTTTYTRRNFGKRPRIDVWIDGPVVARDLDDRIEPARARREALCLATRMKMIARCLMSDYEYVKYVKDSTLTVNN